MSKTMLAAALGTCLLAVTAHAQSKTTAAAQQLVEARKGGMAMMVANLTALSHAAEAENGEALGRSGLAATGMASFARSLPALFAPETQAVAETRALPGVWQDGEDFAAKVREFQAATASVEAATKAGDRTGFAEALARTKAACQSCHKTYRSEKQ